MNRALRNLLIKSAQNQCALKPSRQFRNFSIQGYSMASKDFSVPVPWGHISGVEWGPRNGIPTLAIHGWLDNASTFDPLIPLLRKNLNIFTIDLPGHGRSSHLGLGGTYGYFEALKAIKYVTDFLKLKEFVYMGHSLGGELGYLYSSLFPKEVRQFIGIDLVKPVAHPADFLLRSSRNLIESLIKIELGANRRPPTYTKEEAADRLVKGYKGSITKDSANVLLRRHLVPSPSGNGFMFSFDQRLKVDYSYQPISNERILSFAKEMRCDILFIKAIPGEFYEPVEEYEKVRDFLQRETPNFHYVEVDGSHHVHLDTPEKVAPFINNFILESL